MSGPRNRRTTYKKPFSSKRTMYKPFDSVYSIKERIRDEDNKPTIARRGEVLPSLRDILGDRGYKLHSALWDFTSSVKDHPGEVHCLQRLRDAAQNLLKYGLRGDGEVFSATLVHPMRMSVLEDVLSICRSHGINCSLVAPGRIDFYDNSPPLTAT